MRTYKRKTSRGVYSTQQLNDAANAVKDGKSVNAAAKEFGIKRMTLTRFIKKSESERVVPSMGYATPMLPALVAGFSPELEDSLKNYLLQMASIFYGYSPKDVRRLAYECAVKFGIKIPASWTYPKAAPRKISTSIRRKRKAAILTDTPEKNALQEEQSKSSKKVKKQKKKIENKRKKSVSKKILQSSDESDKDECICLVCSEVWSHSKPGEKWIQCEDCKEWAHKKCVQVTGLHFICINCNSDDI